VLDLSAIAPGIQKSPEGLWTSPTISTVSYPDKDNDICFSVEEGSFWFAHRNESILTAVRRFPPPGAFFDVGGGNGYVAKALQDSGFEVVLVEPGSGACNARERGVACVVRSTLKDAGFRPGVLPAIGLFDVLEHVEDDSVFLSEIYACLIPGGRVYVTVPAFQRLWSHEDVEAGHWRRYTLSKVRAVLEGSGFRIDYATYFFGFLLLPIYLFRALPFSFGISPKTDIKQRTQKDHRVTNPFARRIIGWLSRRELKQLASQHPVGVGASCLVVATKPGL
jgi:SAM-dependent methyltransferase